MNTTPIWVTLVVAALGFVATLGGVLITQLSADKRERQNRADELARESQRWAREDEARTFEQRRDAYISFYETLGQALGFVNSFFDHGADLSKLPLRSGWQTALYYSLQRVEIYGSESIVALAQRAFEVTEAWGGMMRRSSEDPERVVHDEALSLEAIGSPFTFIAAVRTELGVPGSQRGDLNSRGECNER
jgi:hypothetical protein